MSEYENVQKGALQLIKSSSASKKKKRKRKHKADLELKLRQLAAGEDFKPEVSPTSPNESVDTRTKAQKAFAKVKEERQAAEILIRAALTHKERIMKFNENLDNLSEHFDIPKVSWTK